MKKLMFAAAAMLAGVAMADVTSANIVGYNTITPNPEGTEKPCFGLCFTPVSGEKQLLGSFKPAEGTLEYGNDSIQVINPTTQDADYMMSYCDEATAAVYKDIFGGEVADYVGWWYDGYEPGDPEGAANGYEVGLGEGFMGLFGSFNEIQFTSAGQAPTASTSFVVNPDGTEKPVFANYIPRRFPLKYMAPFDGMLEYGNDSIQVINPTTQDADYMMSYCDETTAVVYQDIFGGDVADYVGWWFDGYEPGDPEGSAAGYPVEAGAGFMGLFGSFNEIELQMPSSLITIDDSEFVDPE